ncbi:ATP adenylyltransferase-domain-containing protein [Lipomyces kononenkoae]|uniref:ATP adenylyltransferase-domain-containing protein n=1 Tax=Lipomyces kononenkoae TaxID=34357 RepID=A0ACC3TBK9_LIPKO
MLPARLLGRKATVRATRSVLRIDCIASFSNMLPPLSDAFPDLIRSKFSSAVESGSLIFTPSTEADIPADDLTFRVRIAPILSQKPVLRRDDDATGKPKFNPFLNPEPDLFLCDFGDRYSLILNKFSIVPYHFLCITKEFEPQRAPLSEIDLSATWECLQANIQGGSRLLAFYNCGEFSGASQEHKHIQFIPVPQDLKLLPDAALAYGVPISKDAIGQFPTSHPDVPFAHFVLPIPRNPSTEDLVMRFSSLLARTLTALREHGQRSISFNFAMTKDWMFLAPRGQESYEGISVNATGMVGLLLAKSEEQLDFIKSTGPLEVTAKVGLPRITGDEQQHDY